MDAKCRAARELLEILRLAGAEWAGRPWRTCALKPSSEEDGHGIEKPAFCYFWEAGNSPIEVAFAAHGSVPARKSRTMVIEVGRGLIRVGIPGRKPLIIPDLEPVASDRMVELIPEEDHAGNKDAQSWHAEFDLVSSAMRLIVLAGQAALGTLDPEESDDDPSVAGRLHDWFAKNPGSPLKLAEAGKHFGRSPRQLVRLLKKTTGTGFTEHLNLHRLMLARFLLTRTDRSVVEIARECGFNSREPFIRSFSKAFDWTPLQFRKAWMQASLSGDETPELFGINDRDGVQWLPTDEPEPPPQSTGKPTPVTLIVGNALQEIVELSKVTPRGLHLRHDLLEGGRMMVVAETCGGSLWHVHAVESRRSGYFVAPDSHAQAVIRSETLGGK